MILFVGLLSDPTMTHTLAMATLREDPFTFFDLHKFCLQGEYVWDFSRKEGFIDNGEIRIDIPNSQYTGIYTRPINTVELLPASIRREAQVRMNVMFDILENSPLLTVNRPRLDFSNSTKMYHMQLLQQCGFTTPVSLLTNDPEEASQFIASMDKVIFKGASSEKTIVSLYDPSWENRLQWLGNSPVLFQEYIAGVDVRVHLVGDQCFAEKIECEAIDYRYEKETNRFFRIDVPESIKEKCLRYRDLSGLQFIGFDFKLTPEGQYIIMEANPMPGYNNYDHRAGLVISNALLNLLSGKPASYEVEIKM